MAGWVVVTVLPVLEAAGVVVGVIVDGEVSDAASADEVGVAVGVCGNAAAMVREQSK